MKLKDKLDHLAQLILTSPLSIVPPFLQLKKWYYWAAHQIPWRTRIGYNVVIGNFDRVTPTTGLKMAATAEIGNHNWLDYSGGLEIGRHVIISHHVIIETHDHPIDGVSMAKNLSTNSPLKIEDEAWVASNVIITGKVRRIGQGAVIGAGAVVTKDVPAWAVVGGVPAKIIRYRKKFRIKND